MRKSSKHFSNKLTVQELDEKLEMRPDGKGWRGICPSCFYEKAFLRAADKHNAGKRSLLCTEGCSNHLISISLNRALWNGLPDDFSRRRPRDLEITWANVDASMAAFNAKWLAAERDARELSAAGLRTLLDLKPDGAAWRGTCPACCCLNALFLVHEEGTRGAPRMTCLERCSETNIRKAIEGARRKGWESIVGCLRPCDAEQAAKEARCEKLLAEYLAARDTAEKAIADAQGPASPPSSCSKH